jgi:succinate dehydrogenase hydrophobic anchor subunit
MKLSKRESRVVSSAIDQWYEEGVITDEDCSKLKSSYEVASIDWSLIAKYSFWVAILCIVLSVLSVLLDKWLIEFIEQIFSAPDIAKSGFFAVVAAGFYLYGVRRKSSAPDKTFSNEALFVLGIISTAISIYFIGQVIETNSLTKLILLASIVYGLLGFWIPSLLVWACSLLSLSIWFGIETYQWDESGYFLGMTLPLRFVLFSAILVALGMATQRKWPQFEDFSITTRAYGLILFFLSLWVVSIFGNYADFAKWGDESQFSLIHWSVLLLIASLAALYHGIKFDDELNRGFGLIFVFINLYTRFVEYFWEGTHKALFFAVLAASFWFFGTRAEKIYRLGQRPRTVETESE